MDIYGVNGLSEQEAGSREKNFITYKESKTVRKIIVENSFTFFNILLFISAIMLLYIGSYRDALFITFINIANSGIAIYQEVKAKRILEKLKVLNKRTVKVIRQGRIREVDYSEVVLGDYVLSRTGDQIVADGLVIRSELLSLDESILTGESDYITKEQGQSVTSGTFIVTGELLYQTTAVGNNTYASKLTNQAAEYSKQTTLLQQQIDKMLWLFIYIMIILTFLTFMSQIIQSRSTGIPIDFDTAILNISTVVSALVPTGLVLVTTISYAVAALRMYQYKILVQKLAAVETMAQTTVLCMDKTGTLTTNKIEVVEILDADNKPLGKQELDKILTFASGVKDANKTIEALLSYFKVREIKADSTLSVISQRPFNSKDKFSGVLLNNNEIYFLGAPEIVTIYQQNSNSLRSKIKPYFEKGLRCLFVMKYLSQGSEEALQKKESLKNTGLVSIIILKDRIREDVIETIRDLHNRKIELKILSGDNEESVAAIARMVNINKVKPISGLNLEEMGPEEFEAAALKYTIFGRVTPEQKQRIIESLQKHHRTTAMIGDGVNDVLAIKKADLGIAMNSGVQMAKDSADLVLLDNTFRSLPRVMRQGEEIYANIVKVARLFITKSIYSASLIILTGYLALDFPFLPRQTTLISLITVGIPAIFIALIPTTNKPRGTFSSSVLSFSIGAGVTYTLSSMFTYVVLYLLPEVKGLDSVDRYRTGVAVSLILGGLITAVMVILEEDYSLKNIYKNLASLAIIILTLLIFILITYSEIMRRFFDITTLTFYEWVFTILIFIISTVIFWLQRRFRFIWSG